MICSLDVVGLTIIDGSIMVLLQRDQASWRLPGAGWRGKPPLDEAAAAVSRGVMRCDPAWLEQVRALGAGSRSGQPRLSLLYVALFASGAEPPAGVEWCDAAKLPARLAPQHQVSVESAIAHIRDRMDQVPIAFRLLPALFSLSEIQGVYEVLLGRRLHKASFRRALRAALLVEGTDGWRQDGRGRPAQLFRYLPSRRRGKARTLRLEMPGA